MTGEVPVKEPAQDEPRAGLARRGDWLIVLCFMLAGLVLYTWFATAGNWNLLYPEWFCDYYDALAHSMWRGRLDVPSGAISGEAFVHNGKYYGYFGPTPAFPRMILNRVFPEMYARWSRLMVIALGMAHILLAALILFRLRCSLKRPIALLYLAGVTAGSTVVFLTARSYIYNEALMWGGALTLGAAYCAIGFVLAPSTRYAWGTAICAVLASWSRVTVGAAAMLMCLSLLLLARRNFREWRQKAEAHKERQRKGKQPRRVVVPAPVLDYRKQRAVLVGGMMLFFASFAGMNYVRFGTFLDSMPLKLHVGFPPERLARIGGRMLHPEFAPKLAYDLLSPTSIDFRSSFPWINFDKAEDWRPYPYGFDHIEPYAGVLATAPGFVLLSLVGLIWGVKLFPNSSHLRDLLLFLALAFVPLVCYATTAQRYLHDFFPFLAVAGAFGVKWFQLAGPTSWRRPKVVLTAALLLWSIPANLALTLIFQREVVWGVQENALARYRKFQARVDTLILGAPVPYKPPEVPSAPNEPPQAAKPADYSVY